MFDNQGNKGGGCYSCPLEMFCETSTYRGSKCAAQRAKYGLDDPQTKAEKLASEIRYMTDEELDEYLLKYMEKHGTWEKISVCSKYMETAETDVIYKCSNCGGTRALSSLYCPKCGAKMD